MAVSSDPAQPPSSVSPSEGTRSSSLAPGPEPQAAVLPTTQADTDQNAPKPSVHRQGAVVNPKKPKAGDFEDVVEALILRASFQYEAFVSTKNAYPDTALRRKWAIKAWKSANSDAEENYAMNPTINSLVRPNIIHFLHITSPIPLDPAARIADTGSCCVHYSRTW